MNEYTAGISDDDVEESFLVRALPDVETSMRRLKYWNGKRLEIQGVAEEQIGQILQWEKNEFAKVDKHIDWHEHEIETYHRMKLAEDPKAKTLSLPSGKSVMREATSYEWDDAAVLAWAHENGAPETWFNIKEVPDKAAIKAACTVEDGQLYAPWMYAPWIKAVNATIEEAEAIPGVKVTRKVTHSIKFTEDKAASAPVDEDEA